MLSGFTMPYPLWKRETFTKQRVQHEGEPFDSYLNELKELAKPCQFGAMHDELLRDRIMIGVRNDAIRKQLLQEKDLKFGDYVGACRASESTAAQMKASSPHSRVR